MDSKVHPKDAIRLSLERALSFFRSLRNIFFDWLLVPILAVFVILGFMSLPLSVAWQAEDSKNQSTNIPLDAKTTLMLDYPAMLLVEDKPARLLFSLAYPLTQPLTITLNLPRELILAAPPQTFRDAEPVLTFQPLASRVQTQTLEIANARLVDGFSQQQTISLKLSNGLEKDLPITIEGTLRAALRGFFGNSLNLIITAFLTVVGLVYNWSQKHREAEERKEAERREEARKTKDRFRELMSQQNASRAKEILDDLKQQSLAEYLKDHLEWMHQIVGWSSGKLVGLDFKILPQDWLDPTAGALLFAFYNGHTKDQELRRALRELPVVTLSNDVQNAVQAAIKLPEQARDWPLRVDQPKWELITLGEQWKDRLETNPFPFDYAEDDIPLLFSKVGAFWDGHPLYEQIRGSHKTEIVIGEAGTGKTAMALALGEYLHDKETLACYLSGLPEERDIQYALAKKVLHFVCHHPTFLRQLGQDGRVLLVRVCADALSDQVVLAAMDAVDVEEMDFVKEVQGEERKKRERIVLSQLRLLHETVVSLPARQRLSQRQWDGALTQCARALEFRLPIRVVIDARGKRCADWINEFVLSQITFWSAIGIVANIFVPSSAADAIQPPEEHSWLGFSQLEWDNQFLGKMLDHHFQSIVAAKESHAVRLAIVEDDLWNQMIEKAKNKPRCFIRLWNRMLTLATAGVMDATVLNQALKGFECP